jgi:CheY-like chemotaxis protein
VDLNAVVETALSLTRNELSHRARVVQQPGPVPLVRGNRARLEQVVVNLLVNAAQAIPEDSGQAHTVEVETGREASGRALLRVRDSGVGIRPEDLPRIFEPFFTTKQVGEGTGLGLSICHEIITGLGGTISVESTPGRGTTVSVLLPGQEGPQEALPEPAPPLPPPAAGPRRVLIVDDEVRMGLSMRLLLQPEHEVATTTSAAEALSWVQEGRPFDIILCDLQMPHMSGMELYARLQEVAPQAAERMVFLTGGAFTSAAREFVRTVRNPVLEKPVPPEALLAAIASAPRSPG